MATSLTGSQQPSVGAVTAESLRNTETYELLSPPSIPKLVIRVGVTGHRDLSDADCEALTTAIRESLKEIKDIAHRLSQDHSLSPFISYAPGEPCLRLISPLAEGADQIVAEIALRLEFDLQSPLPFLKNEYEKDFGSQESRDGFHRLLGKASSVLQMDGDRLTENEAYEAVGRTVLRHSDILIAIWDGQHERGAGGTAQVVREAILFDVPILWIDSRSPHKRELLQGPDHGTEDPKPALEERLHRLFLIQVDTPGKPDEQKRVNREVRAAQRFFTPGIKKPLLGRVYTMFRNMWGWSSHKKIKILHEKPEPILKELFSQNPDMYYRIIQNYKWADGLANYYGGLYRSSFVLTFFMGAWAVFFAFMGAGTHNHDWYYFELLFLLIIGAIILFGRKNCWHERWMDFRLLAESLRQVQFLAPLGRIVTSFKVPAHLQPSDPANSWVHWYFRALVRECGMFQGEFEGRHLTLCRRALSSLIFHQIGYHEDNHSKLHKASKRLHFVAKLFFISAVLACIAHFFIPEEQTALSMLLSIFTIVLPAFSGALAAISHQGEFESLATRSEALKKRLQKLQAIELPKKDPVSSKELGRSAETFSDIMLSELLDWRFAFLEKRLDLPA